MSVNVLPFEKFLETLSKTNRDLPFYVNWQKCLKNRDEISIYLNHLNFLLGKSENEMKNAVNKLYSQIPKAFEVLPILIAVRNKNELIINQNGQVIKMQEYCRNQDSIFAFICESGLIDIFSSKSIKDLNDYVFGIEAGLDTNARKNRSGDAMERILANIFKKAGLKFQEQVSIKDHSELSCLFGEDIKTFDFLVDGERENYAIECNFYSSNGSKLNETARSYQELASRFEKVDHYHFVWITDGQGWLKAKNKLQEAYKFVEIYNLNNLDDFIQKVRNGNAK